MSIDKFKYVLNNVNKNIKHTNNPIVNKYSVAIYVVFRIIYTIENGFIF